MDLAKKYVHMNREKGKAVTQVTLDDDFNVPDMKPDLIRIIFLELIMPIDKSSISQLIFAVSYSFAPSMARLS